MPYLVEVIKKRRGGMLLLLLLLSGGGGPAPRRGGREGLKLLPSPSQLLTFAANLRPKLPLHARWLLGVQLSVLLVLQEGGPGLVSHHTFDLVLLIVFLCDELGLEGGLLLLLLPLAPQSGLQGIDVPLSTFLPLHVLRVQVQADLGGGAGGRLAAARVVVHGARDTVADHVIAPLVLGIM